MWTQRVKVWNIMLAISTIHSNFQTLHFHKASAISIYLIWKCYLYIWYVWFPINIGRFRNRRSKNLAGTSACNQIAVVNKLLTLGNEIIRNCEQMVMPMLITELFLTVWCKPSYKSHSIYLLHYLLHAKQQTRIFGKIDCFEWDRKVCLFIDCLTAHWHHRSWHYAWNTIRNVYRLQWQEQSLLLAVTMHRGLL
jgi:hypothetical protein